MAYITRSWTVAAAVALALAIAFRALNTTTTASVKNLAAPIITTTAFPSQLETDTMTTTAAQVSRSVVKSILAIVRLSPCLVERVQVLTPPLRPHRKLPKVPEPWSAARSGPVSFGTLPPSSCSTT